MDTGAIGSASDPSKYAAAHGVGESGQEEYAAADADVVEL
jgi:hypothetical protein